MGSSGEAVAVASLAATTTVASSVTSILVVLLPGKGLGGSFRTREHQLKDVGGSVLDLLGRGDERDKLSEKIT